MRINDYFDHVYVINLKDRQDRMAKMRDQLTKSNVQYDRINAVKPLNIRPEWHSQF